MAELSVWRVLSYWPAIIFWPAIVAGLAAAGYRHRPATILSADRGSLSHGWSFRSCYIS